jgi:hypothetical protein
MTESVSTLLQEPPIRVNNRTGRIPFQVTDAGSAPPLGFGLVATTAADNVAVRLAGGCKGLGDEDKVELMEYLAAGFSGFQGAILSGATREIKDDRTDLMVTDAAVIIGRENPGAVVLGTFPRTGGLALVGDSSLVMGKYDTRPNPGYDSFVIVQDGPDNDLGWDGDLRLYFRLLQHLASAGRFRQVGVVAANGGDVTRDEIIWSVQAGYPTFLVYGFGRATDEIVQGYGAGTLDWLPEEHQIKVVMRSDPQALHRELANSGFFPPQ